MAIAPDLTLRLLLEHKQTFLSLLEEMDRRPTDPHLPTALYNRRIRELAERLRGAEGQRVRDALSLDNLHRNGFLLDWRAKEGTVVWKPWLVEMLRHLDSLRLRELSDKDLEHLRSQIDNVVTQLCASGVSAARGNPDFMELLTLMYNTLNTVRDRLQQNVRSLEAQSQHLAQILESDEVGTLERAQQMREALVRVHRLYDRHIKPMLQFVDEAQDYKDKKNPMALISRLAVRMAEMGFPAEAGRISNIHLSILAHAKDVRPIARLLARYVRQDKEERHRYNAIEKQFNMLLTACRGTLHDGNQRTRFLSHEHPVFQSGDMFMGLKAHNQSARTPFTWADEMRYARVLDEKVRAYQEGTLKRLAETRRPTGADYGEIERRQEARALRETRTKRLLAVLEAFDVHTSRQDIHEALHGHLSGRLEDYALADLVEAHAALQMKERRRLSYRRREFKELVHAGYRLRYMVCTLEAIR